MYSFPKGVCLHTSVVQVFKLCSVFLLLMEQVHVFVLCTCTCCVHHAIVTALGGYSCCQTVHCKGRISTVNNVFIAFTSLNPICVNRCMLHLRFRIYGLAVAV